MKICEERKVCMHEELTSICEELMDAWIIKENHRENKMRIFRWKWMLLGSNGKEGWPCCKLCLEEMESNEHKKDDCSQIDTKIKEKVP